MRGSLLDLRRRGRQIAVGDTAQQLLLLQDPNDAQSAVIRDTNDIVGSQGVFRRDFVDVAPPRPDTCTHVPDTDGFTMEPHSRDACPHEANSFAGSTGGTP
jgi:hypothetical protein